MAVRYTGPSNEMNLTMGGQNERIHQIYRFFKRTEGEIGESNGSSMCRVSDWNHRCTVVCRVAVEDLDRV